jgi:hypothetical protein
MPANVKQQFDLTIYSTAFLVDNISLTFRYEILLFLLLFLIAAALMNLPFYSYYFEILLIVLPDIYMSLMMFLVEAPFMMR